MQMTLQLKNSQVNPGNKDSNSTASASNLGGVKMAKLLKPAKAPTWTKDLTLETYTKQLHTWSDILEDIPKYIKYQDLMESLKTNKEVKGLPRYVGEHVLPTLKKKSDQTILKILDLLDSKYGRMKTERIEEIMDKWMKFKDNTFEDDGELLLGMKELWRRTKELKVT